MRKEKHRANHEDREIGRRLLIARKARGITQMHAAEALSLSFQQIQKYEKGANRVSARRLRDFCELYGMPYGFFLDYLHKPELFEKHILGEDRGAKHKGSTGDRLVRHGPFLACFDALSKPVQKDLHKLVKRLAEEPTG